MTTSDGREPTLESALPEAPQKRDLLGNFCFYLHFVIMLYIVFGWVVPWRPSLIFYLVFLPLVVSQWQFNKNSCVLNNLESFVRTGQWRDPTNHEEGAWLHTLAQNAIGLQVTKFQTDVFIYCGMGALWCLGAAHFFYWK
jgi:hypothetical protein